MNTNWMELMMSEVYVPKVLLNYPMNIPPCDMIGLPPEKCLIMFR